MRATYNDSLPGFVADWNSISRNSGRQIDWDDVRMVDEEDEAITTIPAGTIMAQSESGKLVPRAVIAAEDDETATCILLTAAHKSDGIGSGIAAYGCLVGGVLYANLLPDAENADFADWQVELADASTGFAWETYADDSGS